jgi:hypothetical protein
MKDYRYGLYPAFEKAGISPAFVLKSIYPWTRIDLWDNGPDKSTKIEYISCKSRVNGEFKYNHANRIRYRNKIIQDIITLNSKRILNIEV